MATERQSPDAILAITNLHPNMVSNIQDDPDNPDTSWLLADGNNLDTDVRISFPTPTGNPTVGVQVQEFRVLVKQYDEGQTGTPQARIELWENGILMRAGGENDVPQGGVVLSFKWGVHEIGTADGSLVECKVVGTKTGGAPTKRNTVDVGAVEWNVVYDVVGPTHYGSATLSGTGTLAGVGALILAGLATLAGAGLLSAVGVRVCAGKVTLTGAGALSAVGALVKYGKATLAGTGTLTAAGTVGGIIRLGAATLSGVGSMTALAITTLAGKATLTGVGGLSAIGVRVYTAVASLAGIGTLSAVGGKVLTGAAVLAGTGILSAVGKRECSATAALAGAGALNAIGQRTVAGVATLFGSGLLTATGVRLLVGKATLAGLGTLSAAGMLAAACSGSARLAGVGSLSVAAESWHNLTAEEYGKYEGAISSLRETVDGLEHTIERLKNTANFTI